MNTERPSGKKSELSLAIIEDLRGKGYTQSEIARMYGVTRQYVSWIKHYYGGKLTPRELVLQHFPFQVPVHQQQGVSPYRRLREHGEYMATGGVGMDDLKLSRLRGFYKKLRDHVLEYDPNIPPIEGVSRQGGLGLPAQEARGRRPVDPGQRVHGLNRRGEDDMEIPAEGTVISREPG
ncbi:immunity repressor [Mycobacterium phage Phantastic]|uniref:Immunity repressor n=1 Tax=Mycobacterium phage Phantastic TaxID=1486426 RepID=A0A023W7S6_9CAUD|nr:transcriptional repressor [Mycobacterium phage Phantastic]AHY27138.1 immunity repressor [Mycobacterium phage Phantastic]